MESHINNNNGNISSTSTEKKKREVSVEKRREYHVNFLEKHSTPITCEICGIQYKYFSRPKHLKSRFHNRCIDFINKNQPTQS